MQREESAEQTVDLLAGKFTFRSIEVDFFVDKKYCTIDNVTIFTKLILF